MHTIEKLTGKSTLELFSSINRLPIYELAEINVKQENFGKYLNPLQKAFPKFECNGIFPHTYIKNVDTEVIFTYGDSNNITHFESYDTYKGTTLCYIFCDALSHIKIVDILTMFEDLYDVLYNTNYASQYLLYMFIGYCLAYKEFALNRLEKEFKNTKHEESVKELIGNLDDLISNGDTNYISFSISYSTNTIYDSLLNTLSRLAVNHKK